MSSQDDIPFHNEPSFSLHDFKKWMSGQTDKPAPRAHNHSGLIGTYVESKIGTKRLLAKVAVEDGDIHEVVKDFRQYGGMILDVDTDDNVKIEVDSGTFSIHKFFVRKPR